MNNDIEIKLFNCLQDVSKLFTEAEKIDPEDKDLMTIKYHKAEHNLKTFIENFFYQLFNNGFGIGIEGFTDEDISLIEDGFKKSDESPHHMIDCFKTAKKILRDIALAIYLDPPKKPDLYKTYLDFLPQVFESFKRDKSVLAKKISNYGQIIIQMEQTSNLMNNFRKQSKLKFD